MSVYERECVCVGETNEMAKNENALKMKRDKKKQRENLGVGWGNVRVYCSGSLIAAISKLGAAKTCLLRQVISPSQ